MAKRQLNMHPKLLLDVIKRQAGTPHKAVLEGVMNAIEAGASKVNIDFKIEDDTAILRISDNGKGITQKKEIEDFFETFGTPHDESEGKIWAQFRMGRGQLFSFGKNVWRTGQFCMSVDIKNDGLEYNLDKGLPIQRGCEVKVEFYRNPIGYDYPSIASLKDNIQQQIEFMNVPVIFNGEQLNSSPEKLNWSTEDDDAYYLFGVGTDVSIYNLGAFVMKMPEYTAGVTGIVVSKKQLKVNFARNDIQNDCEVYARIREIIRANRVKRTNRRHRAALTDGERISTLLDIRDTGGHDIENWLTLGLLRTTSGQTVKLDDMRKNVQPWSFARSSDQRADRVMQMKTGMVLDDKILSELRYGGEQKSFFEWLLSNTGVADNFNHLLKTWRPFSEMTQGINNTYRILGSNELTSKEKFILRTLSSYDCWNDRVLAIGVSDTANAWTDVCSYIAIDRLFLKSLYLPYGAHKLCGVLAHELAHDEATTGSHNHGPEFYERFHNICLDRAGLYSTPLSICADFANRLKRSKTMIQQEKVQKRKEKAKAKRDETLGIAANTR